MFLLIFEAWISIWYGGSLMKFREPVFVMIMLIYDQSVIIV